MSTGFYVLVLNILTPIITSIPVQLKAHFRNSSFKNSGYINFGTALNVFHFGYSTKVGIGWSFGAGFERKYNNGVTFFLNPYIGWSGIMSLSDKINDTRYIKLGISFGIGHRF